MQQVFVDSYSLVAKGKRMKKNPTNYAVEKSVNTFSNKNYPHERGMEGHHGP